MLHKGDAVLFSQPGQRNRYGRVLRTGGARPDSLATVMDRDAKTYRPLVHDCRVLVGKEYLDIAYELGEVVLTKAGEDAIENSRTRTTGTIERGKYRRADGWYDDAGRAIEPSDGPGYPEYVQAPLNMARGRSSELTGHMERHISGSHFESDGPGEFERVMRALRAYNPRYFEVYFSHEETGESLVSIARRLGMTPGNARIIKHRAIRVLREIVHLERCERGDA